ncbi:nuclear transport factor 2 family protein [Streptomyces sp. NPDC058773]|uniref:nuclear transport factor 2 family protein n=1 Tax=Streptomyces sp. NPDC058773 TaxID=3346632 RepID=UPI00367E6F8C
MTQRAEHSGLMDRLALDDLITGYAIAVDDGDWPGYLALFTPDGRADYRSAGGIEGSAEEMTRWLAEMLRQFAMRQHLIVNRRIAFARRDGASGDTATVRADYLNPMRLAGPAPDAGEGPTAPNYTCGGRYEFAARRTTEGWRLTGVVVHEKWRQVRPADD